MAEPTADEKLAEGTWPRAWQQTRAICLGFSFFIASSVTSIIAGGVFGVLVGLALFATLIIGVLIGALWTAPRNQRNEARDALRNLQQQLDAPLDIQFETNPDLPIRVPSGGSAEIIVTVIVRNHHPDDIDGVALNFDVPYEVGLESCDENGQPSGQPGRVTEVDQERRYWQQRGIRFLGGGWQSRGHFKLTVREPGEIEVTVKFRLPGFESAGHREVFTAVEA